MGREKDVKRQPQRPRMQVLLLQSQQGSGTLGILGNDPEEGRASNYNVSYGPKGTWQGKGAGDTA